MSFVKVEDTELLIALQPKVDAIVAGINEQHRKTIALAEPALATWRGTAPPEYVAKETELKQSLDAVMAELERLGFATHTSGVLHEDMNAVSTQAVRAAEGPGAAPFGGALGGASYA